MKNFFNFDFSNIAYMKEEKLSSKKVERFGGFGKLRTIICEQYEKEKTNFIEHKDYAYMRLDLKNSKNEEILAYFVPNENPRWKWCLSDIRVEIEISDFNTDRKVSKNKKHIDEYQVESNPIKKEKTLGVVQSDDYEKTIEEKSKNSIMENYDSEFEEDDELLPDDMGIVKNQNAFIGTVAKNNKFINNQEVTLNEKNQKNEQDVLENSLSLNMIDVKGTDDLTSFKMGEYVVVQELYNAVMGNNPSYFKDKDPVYYPVENLTWEDALKFCNELSISENLEPAYEFRENGQRYNPNADGYRLPTLDEWIYASKGGELSEHHKFAGSDFARNVAWWIDDNPISTHPVNDPNKKSNELKIYGMCGNVWEWCWDTKTQAPVCCGGGYDSSDDQITIGNSRFTRKMDYYAKDKNIGFRLAKSK